MSRFSDIKKHIEGNAPTVIKILMGSYVVIAFVILLLNLIGYETSPIVSILNTLNSIVITALAYQSYKTLSKNQTTSTEFYY